MTQPSGLRELEELLERATARPWDRTDGDVWAVIAGAMVCCNQPIANRYGEAECCGQPIAEPAQDLVANTSPDNAALIIAAVNSLPALIEIARAAGSVQRQCDTVLANLYGGAWNSGIDAGKLDSMKRMMGDYRARLSEALAKLESSNG